MATNINVNYEATTNNGNDSNINKGEEFDEMNLSLLKYLEKFNPILLNQLYESSMSCLLIFQELPSMAQNFILRMLFIEQPIPQAVIQSWVKSQTDYNESADLLTRLQIWKSTPMQSGLPGRLLNSIFQKNFQKAYLGGGDQRSLFQPLGPDKHKPDIETLDNYSINKRWDSILNFMAGVKYSSSSSSGDNDNTIGEITKKVIFNASLIENDSKNSNEILITASGFQFLLMDISLQIWFFLRKYLELSEKLFGFNFIECLNFLFELNYLQFGKSYSTQGLNETLQSFLQHLREMGLVYQRKRKDGRFYPTRLIHRLFDSIRNNFDETTTTTITSTITTMPTTSTKQDNKREGFIVVETNYRVYAYTESPLQIALLTLFIELNYRFPKFIVGLITRDSVRAAFKNGITAKQITHYLSMHAHPYMKRFNQQKENKRDKTIIPSTIIDQIFLWEQERNRLQYSDGVLYSQFNSQTDYEALKKYAMSLGVILFENSSKRFLVVTPSGHDEVRRFWKKYKKERD